MQRKDYDDWRSGLFKAANDIHLKKSHDYADEVDVLSNFKRLSKVAEIMDVDVKTPQGYARFMVLMKIDRINNLMKNDKTPNNESIDDTIVDMMNYTILMGACIKDETAGGDKNQK